MDSSFMLRYLTHSPSINIVTVPKMLREFHEFIYTMFNLNFFSLDSLSFAYGHHTGYYRIQICHNCLRTASNSGNSLSAEHNNL